MQPQRLVVPLFQRPYVWNQENQWEPLWDDVVRIAERLLRRPHEKQFPHFLGAVVLQQIPHGTGHMQQRTIIDGQQRLTTLQLLMDALHAELVLTEQTAPAMRLEPLVTNAEPFCAKPEDRFKVWPTNRDRPAFNAVMGCAPPIDHDALAERGARMVGAHRFFSEQARLWLRDGESGDLPARAAAIETVVRDHLQMVVIDLAAEENAQEIFETLNARGAQLTAADLIKNFVFQRLLEAGSNVEDAYVRHWKEFETAFWETEVSVGRVRHPRSSVFLNHWLIARTGEELLAREVFARFKSFADFDSGVPMGSLLEQIDRAGRVYRRVAAGSSTPAGELDRLGLFAYRTSVLESEVVKPVLLLLLDPEQPAVSEPQLATALDVIESWLVRRMLVRATTKNYNLVVAELIKLLRDSDRDVAGDVIERFFASQRSVSRHWPDDDEVRLELRELPAYRRLSRGRLRMVLEAIEDHLRGWRGDRLGLGGERVARGQYAIEHIMPRKWAAHWPLHEPGQTDGGRDRLVHTIGNLTLLTGRLNTKVSNGPWLGDAGKRKALEAHDVLFLNRSVCKHVDGWSDATIRARTEDLIGAIIEIWPVPAGHRAGVSREKTRPGHRIDIADLIGAGLLSPGTSLFPRRRRFADRVGTLLADGSIEIDGTTFGTPSGAAVSLTGRPTNGWSFFLVDRMSRRSLRDVWRDYVDTLAVDAEEEDSADDADDDEE